MLELHDIITGEVVGMAFGGAGIVRHDGFVIFVPFTAPGDKVTCRITQKKKSFANAELIAIERASPQRTKPLCPYFGACGGCQLQHLLYPAQLECKEHDVEDALKRISHHKEKSVLPVVGAEQQWAYRRHITLKLRPMGDAFEAGYVAIDNVSLIKVKQCPIFVEINDTILQEVQQVAQSLKNTSKEDGKVAIFKSENRRFLLHFHFQYLPPNAVAAMENALSQFKNWRGVVLSSRNRTITFGETQSIFEVDQLKIAFSTKAFIQNHPEQSVNIYREICRIAQASNAKKILDLYCGIGVLSLLLASHGHLVKGVEFNPEAIGLAQHNAKINGIEHVSFTQGDVAEKLGDLINHFRPDLVIANPPRTGLEAKVVNILVSSGIREIIYISCMPSTLARDLKMLCEESYHLKQCQPYDMFPQTAHVETIAHLIQK